MKKIKLLITFSIVFSISGCFLNNKINETTYPIALMISKDNNLYYIHLLILNNSIKSTIDTESNIEHPLYQTYIFNGKSINEASQKIKEVTNDNINLSKIKSIILHKTLFDDTSYFKEITNYIINNPLYNSNIYLYFSNDNPNKLLNINSIGSNSNSLYYLENPTKIALHQTITPTNIISCMKSFLDNRRMFYLPSLSLNSSYLNQENNGILENVNHYYIDGAIFLTINDEFYYSKKEDLSGFNWKNPKTSFNLELEEENKLINLKISNSKWDNYIKDEQIYLDLSVSSKINYNYSDLEVSEIEDKLQEYIYEQVTHTYLTHFSNIDIYHFRDLSYRTKKDVTSYDILNLNIDVTIENTIF